MTILINNNRLWDLLKSDENDRLDYKSSDLLTSPDDKNRYKIAKHMVGFANHRGGKIIFGVNDDIEPEGVDLIESECLNTISDIANSMCSPIVSFSHEFFCSSKDDLSEGSVLVLDVLQQTSPPPIAITDRSSGEIRKREYRIRTGESTRLVTDGELVSLFHEKPQLELNESCMVVHCHTDELEPVDLEYTPNYFHKINNIYNRMSGDTGELLDILTVSREDYETKEYHSLFLKVLTISLLRTLHTVSKKQVRKYIRENIDEENLEVGYEFEMFDLKDLEINDEILNQVSFDFQDHLSDVEDRTFITGQDQFGLLVPFGTEISVSDDFGEIQIYLEDSFDMKISVDWHHSGSGLPDEFPESISDEDFKESISEPLPKWSNEGVIQITAEYEYPNQSYSEYMTSKLYCEKIAQMIVDSYDWNSFVDGLPNKKMVQIENKIDNTHSLIKEGFSDDE